MCQGKSPLFHAAVSPTCITAVEQALIKKLMGMILTIISVQMVMTGLKIFFAG
jgi:small neutral amino acid transporter SnatA (MarC family)